MACSPPERGGLDVSAIGGPLRLADPNRAVLAPNERLLAQSTAMGLVALDAAGQIEPALAESWIVTDDGLSTIFRIRRMQWPDGREVTSEDVARSLNRARGRSSRNALKPLLTAIDEVVAMTGRVVEVRLKVPRPNLLQLLAQPEMGIRRGGAALGPLRAMPEGRGMTLLPYVSDAEEDRGDAAISVTAARAALAVARFDAARSALVLGGTLADWPIAQAARVRANRIRIDPADGLFGLAVVGDSPLLADPALRDALSMAIDRDAMATAFGVPRWRIAVGLLPARLDSAALPALPGWASLPLERRRAIAGERVAALPAAAPLRVALPTGPGMRLLFARLAADWRAVGVDALAVAMSADADLRLVDEVAPNASANWYLTRTGCDYRLPCAPDADLALKEARAAPTLATRAEAIARADAAQATHVAFIPIARPVRWSLVDPALTGFRENGFAVHPLAQLRARPR